MKIDVMPCGPLQTNTIVLTAKNTTVIVDPACKEMASYAMSQRNIYVVLTHGHWDHMLALPLMPVSTVYMHRGDIPMLTDPMLNESIHGLGVPLSVRMSVAPLCEGIRHLGDISFTVIHTPGHTPGSISLYFPDENVAIVGDFLFADTIGRTDLPGGSAAKMRASIRKFFTEIPPDTTVYPGHGRVFRLNAHPLYRRGERHG